jgi:transposase
MTKHKRKQRSQQPPELSPKDHFGFRSRSGDQVLESFSIGALPIVNQVLERMDLQDFFAAHLPREDKRTKISTSVALLLLVRNVIMSREPLYGVSEWAERFRVPLLGLECADDLKYLNDDRVGRALDKLFDANIPHLVAAVMKHVTQEFQLLLEEFHNDATTISFHGDYDDANEEMKLRGQKRVAMARGHSKARRSDLKQLLYTLTITDDGGVPVFYAVDSGNASEADTHPVTWRFLCELVGRNDFLYIADCKLATIDNMHRINRDGGRFITVLPATRKEDREFRKRVLKTPEAVEWEVLYETYDDEGDLIKRISRCKDTTLSGEGYRILWCFNTQKQQHDIHMRARQIERAVGLLAQLREKLYSPKTRYRTRAKIAAAVDGILAKYQVVPWLNVEIEERKEYDFKTTKRGRPTKNTKFTRTEKSRFNLVFEIDTVRLAEDNATAGMFSLITNVSDMSDEDIIRAYGRQPLVEKRFKHLKTDYKVAPVFLKEVSRIQGFLAIYFFALVAQALLEREMRRAMDAHYETIPLYPEERPCKSPTTSRIVELFDGIQIHVHRQGDKTQTFYPELSRLQRTLLKLLNVSGDEYGF